MVTTTKQQQQQQQQQQQLFSSVQALQTCTKILSRINVSYETHAIAGVYRRVKQTFEL